MKAGLIGLLIHVPNHVAAGAKLVGHPVSDVFGVGALDGEEEDEYDDFDEEDEEEEEEVEEGE